MDKISLINNNDGGLFPFPPTDQPATIHRYS